MKRTCHHVLPEGSHRVAKVEVGLAPKQLVQQPARLLLWGQRPLLLLLLLLLL
jgi:hypothetical protein